MMTVRQIISRQSLTAMARSTVAALVAGAVSLVQTSIAAAQSNVPIVRDAEIEALHGCGGFRGGIHVLQDPRTRENRKRFRAFAQFGEEVELAVMHVHEGLHDGQAKACALFGVLSEVTTRIENLAANLAPDSDGYLWVKQDKFHESFCQDLTADEGLVMGVTQKAPLASTFGDEITNPAWKSKHSWYQISSDDHMIHPANQAWMSGRLGAKKVITGVQVFDLFEGPSLGADKKSVAIEVAIQPQERTLNDDGSVMRGPQVASFAETHKLHQVTVADLIAYRQRKETLMLVSHEHVILDKPAEGLQHQLFGLAHVIKYFTAHEKVSAIVGMMAAPGHINPILGVIAILCIAVGAGASGALNMW